MLRAYYKDFLNVFKETFFITGFFKMFLTRSQRFPYDHNPFEGIGKPEPLKYELSGKWSRRITDEHRLIYRIANNMIYIYSVKDHYV